MSTISLSPARWNFTKTAAIAVGLLMTSAAIPMFSAMSQDPKTRQPRSTAPAMPLGDVRLPDSMLNLDRIAANPSSQNFFSPVAARENLPDRPAGEIIQWIGSASESGVKPGSGRVVLPKFLTKKLGLVSEGTTVSHTFEISNSGPGPLSLELSEKSCGCTRVRFNGQELDDGSPSLDIESLMPVAEDGPLPIAANASKNDEHQTSATVKPGNRAVSIPAGATAHLEIVVDTEGVKGPFRQSARLKTSDPQHSAIEFRVTGEVRPKVELSSTFLDVLDLRNDGPIERSIEVTSALNPAMEILSAEASHSAVKVRVEKISADKLSAIGAKAGFVVHVSLPRGVPQGTDYEELFVRTNDTGEQTLVIPLVGEVGSTYLTPVIPQLLVAE